MCRLEESLRNALVPVCLELEMAREGGRKVRWGLTIRKAVKILKNQLNSPVYNKGYYNHKEERYYE